MFPGSYARTCARMHMILRIFGSISHSAHFTFTIVCKLSVLRKGNINIVARYTQVEFKIYSKFFHIKYTHGRMKISEFNYDILL